MKHGWEGGRQFSQECGEIRQKTGIGFGAINNSNNNRSSSGEFEGEMFKRWGSGTGKEMDAVVLFTRQQCHHLGLQCRFFCICKFRRCSESEGKIVQGLLPGFRDAKEVQFIVNKKVFKNVTLTVYRARVKLSKFDLLLLCANSQRRFGKGAEAGNMWVVVIM